MTQPLVQVHDLARTFDVSPPLLNRIIEGKGRVLLHAVDGVSFEIEKGRTLALVGESGCGKSTVAKLLVGLYEPTRGSVTFDGKDAHTAYRSGDRVLRQRIQMIFQDPYASLNPRWTVEKIVGEPLTEHRIITNAAQLKDRVTTLLSSVGLGAQDLEKYPHQFSGGQRQRITIAMALACGPQLLIADEPTTALDVTIQRQILELIRDLVAERGMALMLISHDLGVIAQNVRRMLVMYGGSVVESGTTASVFEHRIHPYTLGLFGARPGLHSLKGQRLATIAGSVPELVDLPAGCPFAGRCGYTAPECHATFPPALEIEPGHRARCIRLDVVAADRGLQFAQAKAEDSPA